MSGRHRRQLLGLLALLVLAALVVLLRMMTGRLPGGEIVLAWPEVDFAVYRYKALLAGAVVGSALAISGVLLQALLRNPLASPFILGVSSGAGLGVMVALAVAYFATRDGGAVDQGFRAATMGPAVIGAVVALLVVYALSQRRGVLDPISLVLIGVVISTICGAGIMFCQHLVPTGLRGEFTTWLMGTIPQSAGWTSLIVAAALTVTGLLVAVAMGRAMDAATLSDDEARSVGLSVGPVRILMFAVAGVLTAVTVALAGPIGFVGLIAPHAARLVVGPRHAVLAVGAALAGVILVVGADAARQAIDVGAGRMPIGIFTALIGGPSFIWLLLSGRGQA